jgi:cytoskeletal protein RodZ
LTTSVFLLGVLIVIVGLLTKTPTVEPEESQTTPTPVNKTVDNSRPEDSAAQVPSEKQAGSPPAVGATNPSQSAEPFSYETENIKVMALRALMTQEKDTETIKDDLNYVIQKAQDPTIVKVAKAAKSSLEKGRPFFKDFLDAISGMPL